MILSLHIENIAVVKSLDIDLGGGFTAMTGETGAGKSIIVDCLGVLGGARADKDMIRRGESFGEVSAVFGGINQRAKDIISELGFSTEDDTVMLSRTVFADAPAKARLNGRVITNSVLREISAALFNIHGQNDNQRLLNRENHLALLDTYAGCEEIVEEYSEIYKAVLHTRCRLDALSRDVMENNRMREMLRYQIEDIAALKLKEGEEEALIAESKRLQSAERIKKSCSLVERAVNGGDKGAGAIYLVDRAQSALLQISDAIPEAKALAERMGDIRYELEDICATMCDISGVADEDPTARIDKIEGRLDAISKLKRKYGSTVEEILKFKADAEARLDMIENSEEETEKLLRELKALEDKARAKALEIREIRERAAESLTARVVENLVFLDMPKVRFRIALEPTAELTARGLDAAEFLISANPGEPLMPMIKIASGGELARIMLSLKSVLNECDGIDTAIFDEIDTGISGKTSRKVGIKLREISAGTQVLCVTHSAQIASLATSHLFISKSEQDGRTCTAVTELDEAGRIEEIARILGGIEVSDTQRQAAREMIYEI